MAGTSATTSSISSTAAAVAPGDKAKPELKRPQLATGSNGGPAEKKAKGLWMGAGLDDLDDDDLSDSEEDDDNEAGGGQNKDVAVI